jgi:hypothetical protein
MQVRYSFDGQLLECKAAHHFCSPVSIDSLLGIVNYRGVTLASHLRGESGKVAEKVKQAEKKSTGVEKGPANLPKVQKVTGVQKTQTNLSKIITPKEALL